MSLKQFSREYWTVGVEEDNRIIGANGDDDATIRGLRDIVDVWEE